MMQLGPREKQICSLLLEGYDTVEIAKRLGIAPRTVKAHFQRLFIRFHIHTGIKRVKLAVMLYKERPRYEEKNTAVAAGTAASRV